MLPTSRATLWLGAFAALAVGDDASGVTACAVLTLSTSFLPLFEFGCKRLAMIQVHEVYSRSKV
jgi:hypothetical protein